MTRAKRNAIGATRLPRPLATQVAIAVFLTGVGLSLSAGTLVGCSGADAPDEPPIFRPLRAGEYAGKNIVIVSVDTLRADHLGLYGYHRNTSPILDRLSQDAITFERARAPRGLTWPSLVSLFTSLYPRSSNVRRNGDVLADEVPTLASLLEERGYATAAFLGNACGIFSRNFQTNLCGKDAFIHRKALKWIEERDRSPFLLWIHYEAPHEEYLPPPEYDLFTQPDYRGRATGEREYLDSITLSGDVPAPEDLAQVVGLYDGEVLHADAMMGEVRDALSKRGFLDDSIFVFTSDHGEELLQHHGYFYHACSAYDAVLQIPLLIRLPDQRLGGTRISELVENIHIAPTLLELVGLTPPEGFEGQSLLPLLNREAGAEKHFARAIAEYHLPEVGWIGSLRNDRWHYLYNPEKIHPECRPQADYFEMSAQELYDHSKDPLEKNNVADEHPEVVSRLRTELIEAFETQQQHPPPKRVGRRMIRQLKAMGYLVD